jgi:hypothetical protein
MQFSSERLAVGIAAEFACIPTLQAENKSRDESKFCIFIYVSDAL